jgi:hypothetical protein
MPFGMMAGQYNNHWDNKLPQRFCSPKSALDDSESSLPPSDEILNKNMIMTENSIEFDLLR